MTHKMLPPPLISPETLSDWIKKTPKDIKIFDVSYHLPHLNRDSYAEYTQKALPNAIFLELDDLADTHSDLPHMLPTPEKFAAAMEYYGISNTTTIIVYDSVGLFSSPRAWWMFMNFGHDDIWILDGGLPAWERANLPVTQGQSQKYLPSLEVGTSSYNITNKRLSRTKSDVETAIQNKSHTILDARPKERFNGLADEPRPHVKRGNIPTSINLPASALINENGTFKSPEELMSEFNKRGVSHDKPIITTCGSGITAAVLSLALHICDIKNHALYDGSWAEWGKIPQQ